MSRGGKVTRVGVIDEAARDIGFANTGGVGRVEVAYLDVAVAVSGAVGAAFA